MSNKKVRNLWSNMSKQQQRRYLINNVKSIMGRVKNHDIKLVRACDQIDDVAVRVDMDIDDDIQAVRMDCGIDNVDAFTPNKNLHQSPSNLIKDNLFEEDHPYNCDNNALRCIYHSNGSATLRAINRNDVLGFGRKVIEYLKHPDSIDSINDRVSML